MNDGSASSGHGNPTQAERLVGYADATELFSDRAGQCYATAEIDGHLETWPLKGRRFAQWLLRRYYLDTGKATQCPGHE